MFYVFVDEDRRDSAALREEHIRKLERDCLDAERLVTRMKTMYKWKENASHVKSDNEVTT